MTDTKLTTDDARALLGEHIEGTLDDAVTRDLDALLANDPALAAERRRLQGTMALLKGLDRPEPPADMVGKVRDRLAAERRAPAARTEGDNVVRPRRFNIEVAVGLAAAAGIAVFFAVAGPMKGDAAAGDTAAAGVAGDVEAVRVSLVAPGLEASAVDAAAAKAGMARVASPEGGASYEGGRREAARFVLALKVMAAEQGTEVSGFIPDAERVRIDVKGR